MATELDCADALIRRARALLTGEGLLGLKGIESGDRRWTQPTLRAAAILAAAGAAILVDMTERDAQGDETPAGAADASEAAEPD